MLRGVLLLAEPTEATRLLSTLVVGVLAGDSSVLLSFMGESTIDDVEVPTSAADDVASRCF